MSIFKGAFCLMSGFFLISNAYATDDTAAVSLTDVEVALPSPHSHWGSVDGSGNGFIKTLKEVVSEGYTEINNGEVIGKWLVGTDADGNPATGTGFIDILSTAYACASDGHNPSFYDSSSTVSVTSFENGPMHFAMYSTTEVGPLGTNPNDLWATCQYYPVEKTSAEHACVCESGVGPGNDISFIDQINLIHTGGVVADTPTCAVAMDGSDYINISDTLKGWSYPLYYSMYYAPRDNPYNHNCDFTAWAD